MHILIIAAENISGRIHKKLLTLIGKGIGWLRRLHCIYFNPFWMLNHVNVLPTQKITFI